MADLKEDEVERAREVFGVYDMRAEGHIDAAKLGDILRSLGLCPTLAAVYKNGGTKKEGEKKLTFEEFLPIFSQMSKEKDTGSMDDFLEGLKVFDKEANGNIVTAELRHIMGTLGERLTGPEIDTIMQLCGCEDSDGNTKYEEFLKKVMAGPYPDEDK